MASTRTAKRSVVDPAWQPGADQIAFADSLGVNWGKEWPAFIDHHEANGNLMASWPAAWRTWCRKAVEFGRASGAPISPLFAGDGTAPPADDPYGVTNWARGLKEAVPDTCRGMPILALAGHDVVGTARDVCAAAGQTPGRPADWGVRQWPRRSH